MKIIALVAAGLLSVGLVIFTLLVTGDCISRLDLGYLYPVIFIASWALLSVFLWPRFRSDTNDATPKVKSRLFLTFLKITFWCSVFITIILTRGGLLAIRFLPSKPVTFETTLIAKPHRGSKGCAYVTYYNAPIGRNIDICSTTHHVAAGESVQVSEEVGLLGARILSITPINR